MKFETICLVRLLFAGLLGGLIGLEREYRSKEAGLRTHFMVAIGSALFMLVSQYGFVDALQVLTDTYPSGFNFRVDLSRVASQVVSGIGFIGAGMIVLHKRFVMGLTTAAGIWTTSAIGLAVGGGMFFSAILGTALVLAGFEMFRLVSDKIGKQVKEVRVAFIADSPAVLDSVMKGFREQGKGIAGYSSMRTGDKLRVNLSLDVRERDANAGDILEFLRLLDGVEVESVE